MNAVLVKPFCAAELTALISRFVPVSPANTEVHPSPQQQTANPPRVSPLISSSGVRVVALHTQTSSLNLQPNVLLTAIRTPPRAPPLDLASTTPPGDGVSARPSEHSL
jgi:hypothetical protein